MSAQSLEWKTGHPDTAASESMALSIRPRNCPCRGHFVARPFRKINSISATRKLLTMSCSASVRHPSLILPDILKGPSAFSGTSPRRLLREMPSNIANRVSAPSWTMYLPSHLSKLPGGNMSMAIATSSITTPQPRKIWRTRLSPILISHRQKPQRCFRRMTAESWRSRLPCMSASCSSARRARLFGFWCTNSSFPKPPASRMSGELLLTLPNAENTNSD